jgi:hypothetical protein
MEFMLILLADREAPEDPNVHREMGRFASELAGAGQLRGGAPLKPESEGVRITGEMVTIGPFPSRVVLGGYLLVECRSRAEAIAIARRCPHARVGTVEVRQVVAMRPPLPRGRKKSPARAPRKAQRGARSPARRKKR